MHGNALFFLKSATRSSLFEGILLAARCAGNAEGLSAKLTEGVVPLHNTAAAIAYPHVNTTSSAAQTDSPTACAVRLFRLCACRIGSVASA